MRIGLASPAPSTSLDDALSRIARLLAQAAGQGAQIVCFPEAYLPGLRGQDFDVWPWDEKTERQALDAVAHMARDHAVGVVMGIEHLTPGGRKIGAVVFDPTGEIDGMQTKNQLDPSEDQFYVPGAGRRLFQVGGIRFGVAICHEGWRYPETVRWAAARGASLVFHPQHTGYEREGMRLTTWGDPRAPYYERAMLMRSLENTIYFASVNYALRFQESATSLITPQGTCQAWLPYGEEGVLVETIDVSAATGLLAQRYAPDRHHE